MKRKQEDRRTTEVKKKSEKRNCMDVIPGKLQILSCAILGVTRKMLELPFDTISGTRLGSRLPNVLVIRNEE